MTSYFRGGAWRVIFVYSLAQNCALGFGYGSFGPLLASTEARFHVTRAVATLGMSLITLAISISSPLAAGLLRKTSVRLAMMFGAILSSAGYWGLALFAGFGQALAMYALIGLGITLLAILGPVIVVNRWFDEGRAKILSLVNLPIMMFAVPFIVAELLPIVGRLLVLASMGVLFLALIPLLMLVADRPPAIAASELDLPASAQRNSVMLTLGAFSAEDRRILASPRFWLLSYAIGAIAGSGTAFMVHVVPFGTAQGMTLQSASGLLSVYAGAGIFGTLFFGWLCDKVGPYVAVLTSAASQAVLWLVLTGAHGATLFGVSAALGICVVPLVTYHGASLSELFGPELVGRAMGFSYALKLPFLFCFAPFVAFLFDRFGNYRVAFLVTALILTTAAMALFALVLSARRRGEALRGPVAPPCHRPEPG